MVILVLRIHIEGKSQLPIPFKACTLLIALEDSLQVTVTMFRCTALGFLLDPLAFTGDENLLRTGLLFFASSREVTRCHARVSACTELFATRLGACLIALSGSMTLLLAFVCTAFQGAPTHLATVSLVEPTRLVLQNALPTQASLCGQISAFRTVLVVAMTAMIKLWVSTVFGSLTLEPTWWRIRTARQWRLKNSATTMTTELIEDGIATSPTRPFVA